MHGPGSLSGSLESFPLSRVLQAEVHFGHDIFLSRRFLVGKPAEGVEF